MQLLAVLLSPLSFWPILLTKVSAVALNWVAAATRDIGPRVRVAAEAALLQLLPAVDETVPFDDAWVQRLCGLLEHDSPRVVLSVLRALERVGDERAVTSLRRVTYDERPGIAEEAAKALAVAEERARRKRDPAVLVRPAIAPADTLLRAAHGSNAGSQELLVRPGIPDEDIDV